MRSRRRSRDLPNVTHVYPFLVPIALTVSKPAGMEAPLIATSRATMNNFTSVLVAGRRPDPKRADEIVVSETTRDKFGLDIGSTVTMVQHAARPGAGIPPELAPNGIPKIEQRMRVVGIADAPTGEADSTPSVGFYDKYRTRLIGIENQFVALRHGRADFVQFQAAVQRVLGHPVNVASAPALFGVDKVGDVSHVERNGVLLFALGGDHRSGCPRRSGPRAGGRSRGE